MFCKVCLFASTSPEGGIIDLGLKHGPHPVLFPLGLICHFLVVSFRSYHIIEGQLRSIAGIPLTHWGLLVAAGANLPACPQGLNFQVFTPSCSSMATLNQCPMGVGKCPGSLTLSSVILRCVFFTGSLFFLCCGVKLHLLMGVTYKHTAVSVCLLSLFQIPTPYSCFLSLIYQRKYLPLNSLSPVLVLKGSKLWQLCHVTVIIHIIRHFRSPWS